MAWSSSADSATSSLGLERQDMLHKAPKGQSKEGHIDRAARLQKKVHELKTRSMRVKFAQLYKDKPQLMKVSADHLVDIEAVPKDGWVISLCSQIFLV